MQPHFTTEFLLSAAAALAAGRLLHLGLGKEFASLVAWLGYACVSALALAVVSPKSVLYFWMYVAVLPFDCLFAVFAVRALFGLIFNNYPGIRTVGRWAMYAATALSVAVTVLATRVFWSQTSTGRAHSGIYYLQVAHRSVIFSLALIILSLLFSISRYPLHLGQNTYISSGFFGAVFLSEAAQSLMDSFAPRLYNNYIDWTSNLFVAVCLLAWAGWLKRGTVPMMERVSHPSPSEDHLLQELASLNQLLSRAARG